MGEAEKKRLFLQAKKRKELNKVFPSIESVLDKIGMENVKLKLEFKDEEDLHNFLNFCPDLIEFWNFVVEAGKNEVNLGYKGDDPEDLKKAVKYLYSLKPFHLAKSLFIEEKGEKVFVSSDEEFGVPKIPYTSKTSFRFSSISGEKEKNLLKKIVYDYFSQSVLQILLKACEGRYVAYEKLEEIGKEDHLRWRVNLTKKLYEKILVNDSSDLTKLLETDAFGFYPAVFQFFNFEGMKLKLRSRIVTEFDPSPGNEKYAAEICEMAQKHLKGRLMFSGSKSGRIEFEVDVEGLLKKSEDLMKEFSWLGYFLTKSVRECKLEDFYKIVLRGFEHSIYFMLLDELESSNYPFKRLILRKNSPFKISSVLLDFPKTVSIAMSSPKAIVRLGRNEIPKDLLKYEKFRKWCSSYPFHILVCVPEEKIPYTREDILRESHIIFAFEKLSRGYEKYVNSFPKIVGADFIKNFLEKMDERKLEVYLTSPYKFERDLILKS
ncbi:MAG: hypothetical protein QXG39_04030 [Candidatus Aenigmatarchaeota archaeon]